MWATTKLPWSDGYWKTEAKPVMLAGRRPISGPDSCLPGEYQNVKKLASWHVRIVLERALDFPGIDFFNNKTLKNFKISLFRISALKKA
jgi:hypothetical protein